MWFTEDALTPGVIFAAAGLILILSGLNAGRRSWAILGVISLIVGGLGFVIDAAVVTEREQIEARVRNLCDDFRHKRPATLDYFSPTTPGLSLMVKGAMDLVDILDEPRITDFEIQITNQGSRATSHFRANATISVKGHGDVGYQPSRFVLTWAREGSEWKIIRVQRFDPVSNRELGVLDQVAR